MGSSERGVGCASWMGSHPFAARIFGLMKCMEHRNLVGRLDVGLGVVAPLLNPHVRVREQDSGGQMSWCGQRGAVSETRTSEGETKGIRNLKQVFKA